MHNPEQIETMTDPEAQALAELLAIQLCGSDRFKTDLAERLGCTRPAVNRWFADGGRPPMLVIMYLESELARLDAIGTLQLLHHTLDGLRAYS